MMELEIFDVFRNAGIEEAKAKAVATTLNRAMEQNYLVHSKQHATEGDVEKVRLEVEKVRLEIEKVRGEMEKTKAEIIKWNVATMLGGIGAALAIVRLFFMH